MFVSLKTFRCPICDKFYNKKFLAPNGICKHCEKELLEIENSMQLPLFPKQAENAP